MTTRAWGAYGGVLAAALVFGGWGIGWGLPSRWRLSLVQEPGMDTPAFQKTLQESWVELHKRLGANLMLNPESYHAFTGVQRVPAGWSVPPELLMDSVRSFYTRSVHEDEQTNLLALSKMHPGRLDFNPHFFSYGGTYIYGLGAWLALGAVLHVMPLYRSLAPYLEDPGRMGAMYLWGRWLSVAAYAACGLMLVRLGRSRLGTLGGGAFGAMLFLLSPMAVIQAHTLKHYTYWTLAVLLALDRSVAVLDSGTTRDYVLAGIAAGLAVGTFLPGWPTCLVIAAAAAMRVWLGRGAFDAEARGLALAAAASLAAAVLTNPYWVLDFHAAFQEIRGIGSTGTFGLLNPLRLAVGPMSRAVTGPVVAASWAGAAWAVGRGRREPALLLAGTAFWLGMASSITVSGALPVGNIRYFLPWIAVGTLLAGRAAAELLRRPRARGLAAAACALVLADSGLAAATYARNFGVDGGPDSTHVRAGAWLEANVPPGTAVGLLRLPQPASVPYFHLDRYELRLIEPRVFGALAAADLPPVLVVTLPDYDERPLLGANLARYERAAAFERERVVPWVSVDPTATTTNPVIEVYRLKPGGGT